MVSETTSNLILRKIEVYHVSPIIKHDTVINVSVRRHVYLTRRDMSFIDDRHQYSKYKAVLHHNSLNDTKEGMVIIYHTFTRKDDKRHSFIKEVPYNFNTGNELFDTIYSLIRTKKTLNIELAFSLIKDYFKNEYREILIKEYNCI